MTRTDPKPARTLGPPSANAAISHRFSAVRALTARRPLTAFLIIVFGVEYPLVALAILATHGVLPGGEGVARLPVPPDQLLGLLMTLAALLPATLYVTWATDGGAGVRQLFARMVRWRVGASWWLTVLFGLPTLTVGIALLLGDTPRAVDPVAFIVGQLALLAINLALVNLWEESAWAGFLQTRLGRRHNVFLAALITAVPFAFAHWPLAFLGEVTVASVAIGLLTYLLLGVIFRPMIGVFLQGTRGSVLAVAALHSVFNRTNNDNGIAAGLLDGDGRGLATFFGVIVLTGAIVAVSRRRRLGRNAGAPRSISHR